MPKQHLRLLYIIAAALESNQVLGALRIQTRGSVIPLNFYEALGKARSVNKALDTISIYSPEAPKGGCLALTRGLACHSSVRTLYMPCPEDDPARAVEIVKAAQTNSVLQEIIFRGECGIRHKDQIAALDESSGNRTLKTLWMKRENMPDMNKADAASLVQAVRKSYGLVELKVNCDDKTAKQLGTILRLNAFGRRYIVEENTRKLGVEILAKVTGDLDCIYTHLLENPAVLCNFEQDIGGGTKRKLHASSLFGDRK
jgi:hypothetical protein